MADLSKNPWPTLSRAANHDCVGLGVFEYVLGFLWRGDIAIGDDGDSHRGLHRGNGVVLRMSRVGASAGAAMNGQHLQPALSAMRATASAFL